MNTDTKNQNLSSASVETHRASQREQTGTPKRMLFKTAQAVIGCAKFDAGDFVAVKYYGQARNGTHWYLASKSGRCVDAACYPEHHLTKFVL